MHTMDSHDAIGSTDTFIYRTRKERQEVERRRHAKQKQKRLKWLGLLSITTGLSLNSLATSHVVRGTEAMLTSSASTSLSFSAADHFPQWYHNLVVQMNVCEDRAGNLLADMQAAVFKQGTSRDDKKADNQEQVSELNDLLNQLQDDQSHLRSGFQSASGVYATISQAASEDQSKYGNTHSATLHIESLAQSDSRKAQAQNQQQASDLSAFASSEQRIVGWGQSAEGQGSSILSGIGSDVASAQQLVAQVRSELDAAKAAEHKHADQASKKTVDQKSGTAASSASIGGGSTSGSLPSAGISGTGDSSATNAISQGSIIDSKSSSPSAGIATVSAATASTTVIPTLKAMAKLSDPSFQQAPQPSLRSSVQGRSVVLSSDALSDKQSGRQTTGQPGTTTGNASASAPTASSSMPQSAQDSTNVSPSTSAVSQMNSHTSANGTTTASVIPSKNAANTPTEQSASAATVEASQASTMLGSANSSNAERSVSGTNLGNTTNSAVIKQTLNSNPTFQRHQGSTQSGTGN